MKKLSIIILLVNVIGIWRVYGDDILFYYQKLQDSVSKYYQELHNNISEYYQQHFENVPEITENKQYSVKQGNTTIGIFDYIEDALLKAENMARTIVIDNTTNTWIHTTLNDYILVSDDLVLDFANFTEAYEYAKENDGDVIYFKNNEIILWEAEYERNIQQKINVPHIKQLPELGRGCEVTSLAMLLNYYGINVSKMTLAEEIKKDETSHTIDENGKMHFGNPYDGFVGDMYNLQNEGYGVYHGPITDLANQYITAVDLTGIEFEDLLNFVSRGYPILVITNATYKYLPEYEFELWHTPTGIVKVTRRMHSVVVTGYTEKNVIINDPLYYTSNRVLDLQNFKEAWEQMGHQAVMVLPQV
ncbi:hypothetical protein AN640_02145 [Candidatus Epulonipiscium fishelsonii]|uniref:Uncharacterized protein n=1 Tax=Candidatus Epulonipiscium fishelsonii TaxID=77094 RepID=A0ACC8X9U8_9FIRM|nr:hypothetical protein AN640_02145 [Epulopiscium sp. SCG-D08WGA-EpuloA1]OON95020.1 MAG: hypothetical protein ATN32_07520 [Epulopiscium sp. AS2M-Bin002]